VPYHRLGAENYLPHRETDYSAATRNADINVTAVLATLMVHWFVLKGPGFNYLRQTVKTWLIFVIFLILFWKTPLSTANKTLQFLLHAFLFVTH
jgi:hypothetical protein